MIQKLDARFFLLTCLSLIMLVVWGCAKKPVSKPIAPESPETPAVEEGPKEAALIDVLMAEAGTLAADGNYQDALLIFNQALDEAGRLGADTAGILSAIETVLSRTPPQDIASFSTIKNLTIPPELFVYWQGRNWADQGEYTQALVLLESFLETYPGHERVEDVRALVDAVQRAAFDKTTLGVMLPLSGKFEIYGQRALRGIQLAVHDLSRSLGHSVKVIVKDTRSDPEQAAECVAELARENVFAIAGPLLVPEAAGEQAERLGVPLVALTQKSGFPSQGDYLFANFITPEMQVETLGSYVFGELGLKKVAILYPDERYGRRYMELFWDVTDRFRAEVVGVEAYDGRKTDFTTPIQKLTGEFYPLPDFLKPAAEDQLELPEAGEELDSDRTASARGSAVANEDRIEIGFEALFIPDALSRVNLILPQLAFNDARGMVLLGTNLWHQDSLLTQAKGYNKNAVICDGYFGASENPITAGFHQRFQSVFDEPPGFLEAIAYDTASLLFSGVMKPEVDSREGLKQLLQGNLMFTGVTGRTTFDESGNPRKELFLITVQRGAFKEINR